MKKKIIILNGSPRAKGNTSSLVEAFSKGATEAGHEVTTFFLDQMSIKGCKGCFGGGKDVHSPCVIKDDMDLIYPVFQAVDIIVMASPMYYWNFSGQLRTTFDRLFAVAEAGGDLLGATKESILIMAAAGEDFTEIDFYYNRLMQQLGWMDLGKILAGGVNNLGDIKGRIELEKAYLLGKNIV